MSHPCEFNLINVGECESVSSVLFAGTCPRKEAHEEVVRNHGFWPDQWYQCGRKAMEIALEQFEEHHMLLGLVC